ncbi:general secretion pathway protein GspK, partial [bacterium]|nr:general secretion pathway protein GspK [bacterium]
VNKIKAHYAAKAGAQIGLLRVSLYQKALAMVGDDLGENKDILNTIWQLPLSWPIKAPDNLNAVDKSNFEKIYTESLMQSKFMLTIESEDSKIDINSLASDSKAVAGATKKQILQLFQNKIDSDEDFEAEYANYDFNELVNYITDWIDEDKDSLNSSADEASDYDVDNDFIPPNQGFKTIQELKMVKEMTSQFFDVLKNNVTVYGSKTINVNDASKEVLMSIDPQITSDAADMIIKRRENKDQGGPFTSLDDLKNHLGGELIDPDNLNPENIPLSFNEQHNFRIKSTGEFANIFKDIEVVTMDTQAVKNSLITALDEQDKQTQGGSSGTSGSSASTTAGSTQSGASGTTNANNNKNEPKKEIPTGRPTIVYWDEN